MGSRLRRSYGAGPRHLLAAVVTVVLSGYAVVELLHHAAPIEIAAWFLAAIVAHDLVLLPVYSLLGALAHRGLRVRGAASGPRLAALNHLRIAGFFVVLPLIVWGPLILGLGAERYRQDTGVTADVYLGRWLLFSAAICAGSAVVYVLRLRRARSRAG
ncbi:MAG: hypothetical protein ACR2KV_03630 [Solirubrobacteraceae bacterium]